MGLLAAIFVSNLPESVGSASDMEAGGESRRADQAPLATGLVTGAGFAVATACQPRDGARPPPCQGSIAPGRVRAQITHTASAIWRIAQNG